MLFAYHDLEDAGGLLTDPQMELDEAEALRTANTCSSLVNS